MKIRDLQYGLNPTILLLLEKPPVKLKVDSFLIQDFCDIAHPGELHPKIQLNGEKKIRVQKIYSKQKALDILPPESFIFHTNKIKKNLTKNISAFSQISQKIKSSKIDTISQYSKHLKIFSNKKISISILSVGGGILILTITLLGSWYFGSSGYEQLQKIPSSTSLKEIQELSLSAERDFSISKFLFSPFQILPGTDIKNISLALNSGRTLSRSVREGSDFIIGIERLIDEKGIEQILFSQLLENNTKLLEDINTNLQDSLQNLSMIDSSHFEKQQKEIFETNLSKIQKISHLSNILVEKLPEILDILGHNERKRYALLFQNSDEIRPHGGFIGSIGIVEVFRGQVKKFEKNDVYFYEFKIKKEDFERKPAPHGLHTLTQNLGLRDSNYFINNEDSAENISYFLEKADVPIDGIIYLNQNTLLELLKKTGGFHSQTLNQEVTAGNFSSLMSLLVESKVSQNATLESPKGVLFDFIDEYMSQLQKLPKISLLSLLCDEIGFRELEIFLLKKNEQSVLEEIGMAPQVDFEQSFDFDYPVFTSISGNKSDRYIQTSFSKEIIQKTDCSIQTTLNIKLEHTFSQKDTSDFYQSAQKYGITNDLDKLLFIQGNGENKQYLRIIIPKDAQLNSNITSTLYENRGQMIETFLNTPVGGISQYSISYILANPLCKPYSYSHFKQAGLKPYTLSFKNNTFSKVFEQQKGDISIP